MCSLSNLILRFLGVEPYLKSDMSYEVVLIDATETPIERSKKTKDIFTREKRKSTR